MTAATTEHVRRLPKVELHCHVEGAARASTIAELAAKHDVTFPVDDPADLYDFTSLNQFLQIYDVICQSLVDADDFRRITYEALEDASAADVRYREMLFSPGFVIRLGVPVETVWEGVRAGLLDARRDFDLNADDPRLRQADRTGPRHGDGRVRRVDRRPRPARGDRRRFGRARHRPRMSAPVPAGRPPRAGARSTPARTDPPRTSASPSTSSAASADTASGCSTTSS